MKVNGHLKQQGEGFMFLALHIMQYQQLSLNAQINIGFCIQISSCTKN